eukprot:SAG22_NODE_1864_length_3414_cov_1.391855_7_plen_62_part_00
MQQDCIAATLGTNMVGLRLSRTKFDIGSPYIVKNSCRILPSSGRRHSSQDATGGAQPSTES